MHESAIADSTTTDASTREQLAYTVPEAAKCIGMGERKMRQLVADGTIRSFKVGTSRRISRAALLAFIEQQENAA